MALKAVSDKEAKRILEKSPPTKDLLFGDKVKESVQQIRDSLQIKRVFRTPRPPYPRRTPYTKPDGQYRPGAAPLAGRGRNPQRLRQDRFKGAPRGRFSRNNRGKEDKPKEED